MRILMINPNTSAAITEMLATRMREVAGPSINILSVTGRFGARYIASRAAAAIAGHAALDALAEHVADCDVVYLACFGEPGLAALKEVSPVPVVGMAEASVQAACELGSRFAIRHRRCRLGTDAERTGGRVQSCPIASRPFVRSSSRGEIARDRIPLWIASLRRAMPVRTRMEPNQ
jgi:hypothetical protein